MGKYMRREFEVEFNVKARVSYDDNNMEVNRNKWSCQNI